MATEENSSCKTLAEGESREEPTAAREVILPPNVSIYSAPSSAKVLRAVLFTRLVTTVQAPAQLATALGPDCASFCHQHHNTVLIFDDDDQDTHHEHFRQVCMRLKANGDLGLDYGRCVFDARSSLQAGFQMDQLQSGAVMMVDLQDSEDDDDEGGDDDDDDSSLLEALGEPADGVVPSDF
ncbi:hypothetical protein F5Y16DRAFT_402248 [Xylariaceae sp. FL0255]|nr:hypothetical protein F5Y16DRAFT_402248 [Xylariaceae sp. FL0255]